MEPTKVYIALAKFFQRWLFAVRLLNTASGKLEQLTTHKPEHVRMYVCGPTVYDYNHLGHARTFVIGDTLRRFLEHVGYKVLYVQNITDVEDKIIARAKRDGVPASKIAERFTKQYFEDLDGLNIKPADLYPKATEHIADMIRMVTGLVEKGFAYITTTGVYFDVSKFPKYGQISRQQISELEAGARVEPDPTKKHPFDFALWKFASDDPSWKSPWGRGRPGWHLECSAMALKHLGEVDIHAGGEDLIFPHHENEATQSEAYTGKPFARIWMHVGWVEIGGRKMSKSVGNIIPIHQALQKWPANAIRIFALLTHYRKKQDFSEVALQQADNIWRSLEESAWNLLTINESNRDVDKKAVDYSEKELQNFRSALSDDFNTPLAIQAALRLARSVRKWVSAGTLNRTTSEKVQEQWAAMFTVFGLTIPKVSQEERERVSELIARRAALRDQGSFQEADRIREQLKDRGVELLDYGRRTLWKKVAT